MVAQSGRVRSGFSCRPFRARQRTVPKRRLRTRYPGVEDFVEGRATVQASIFLARSGVLEVGPAGRIQSCFPETRRTKSRRDTCRAKAPACSRTQALAKLISGMH